MSTEIQEQRAHHDYSPSTLQSLEACPNYQSRQSDTPHPRTVIGTLSHGVTETGEDDARLTDEDTEKVAECIDFFDRRKLLLEEDRARAVQKLSTELWGQDLGPGRENYDAETCAEQDTPPIIVLRETYLPIDDLTFEDKLAAPYGNPAAPRKVVATTAGYIDSALISWDKSYAEIFDWKFGFWPVEAADNNLQGIAYALGMFKMYPTLEKIQYFFKQPNLDYITSATIRRTEIEKAYLRIQVVVARARAARTAGDFKTARAMVPACNFCAHIAHCPVVTELACKVGSKFFPAEIPSDITPTMVHNATDTKLGLQLAAVLEVWAGAFKRCIANRVITREAETPDGYIIQSRTPREIKDPEKYRLVALKYLTEAEYATTLKASFGKVEELISQKAPRGQKQAQVAAFAQEIEECGAVAKGEGYTFLRAVPKKPTK